MNRIQACSRSTDWHYHLSNTWMESKSPSLLSQRPSTAASCCCYCKESKHVVPKLYWQTQCAPCVLWPGKLLEDPPSKKALSLSLSPWSRCMLRVHIQQTYHETNISWIVVFESSRNQPSFHSIQPFKHRPSRYIKPSHQWPPILERW